jgi:hypothetical protein
VDGWVTGESNVRGTDPVRADRYLTFQFGGDLLVKYLGEVPFRCPLKKKEENTTASCKRGF